MTSLALPCLPHRHASCSRLSLFRRLEPGLAPLVRGQCADGAEVAACLGQQVAYVESALLGHDNHAEVVGHEPSECYHVFAKASGYLLERPTVRSDGRCVGERVGDFAYMP